jgi:BolA family transcriptional regulator, general stress-responsive regulator
MQTRIELKLREAFSPTHLDIQNESHKHNVPSNSETHFKVTVVSECFDGQRVLDRHRAVNELLAEELRSGVHALSIRAKTPAQFDKLPAAEQSHQTPNCLGGSKK